MSSYLSIFLHNTTDAPAVSFPHASESRLAADIPQLRNESLFRNFFFSARLTSSYFDRYVSFRYFAHIETDRRDHVFVEVARLDEGKGVESVWEGGRAKRNALTAITLTNVVFPEF